MTAAQQEAERLASPATGTRAGRRLLRGTPVAMIIAAMVVLIVLPIGFLVYASVVSDPPRPGSWPTSWTLDNFAWVFQAGHLRSVGNSLIIGVGGSAAAVTVGGLLAWIAARTNVRGRGLVQVAGIIPLFLSPFIGALAWSLVASPERGYINLFFAELGLPFNVDLYTMGGIIFIMGLYYAPYTYLFVYSALTLMNPELEEAASTHGASLMKVLTKVTFPLVRPALLGAIVLTAALIMEDFPVPQLLGAPAGISTVPSTVFRLMTQSPAEPNIAAAAGVQFLTILVILVAVQRTFLKGRDYTTVSGKGFRPRHTDIGKWRWVALGFTLLYLLLAVVVPIMTLIISALRTQTYVAGMADLFDVAKMSFDNFVDVLMYEPFQQGFKNSLLVAALTALIGGAVHFLAAFFANRRKGRTGTIIEQLAMAPAAIPALILGLGLLWTWIRFPGSIYGTVVVLALACIARFFPQGYRGIASTIGQVHSDLEDSAVTAGATRSRAVREITLPLIRTGVLSTVLLLIILSLRELSAALFLFTHRTQVLSIVIYEQWESGNWARVAAMSIWFSLLLAVIVIVSRRWLSSAASVSR